MEAAAAAAAVVAAVVASVVLRGPAVAVVARMSRPTERPGPTKLPAASREALLQRRGGFVLESRGRVLLSGSQRHERLHRRRLGAVRRELLRAAFQLHVVVLPLRALQRLDLREVDGDGERERWVLRPGHQPALVLLALSLSHRRGFVDDVLLQTRHREFLRDGRYPHLTRDARAAAHDANLRQVAVPPPALHVPQHDVRFHEDVREHLVQRVFHRAVQAREVADVDHRRRHRLDRH
mmetsp:Transcript_5949/g.21690  ORF Transcript_5949/g.21690 Transcript_5949/m.21690 type:complete len:237 (-) Transcript_5949:196-906(-)